MKPSLSIRFLAAFALLGGSTSSFAQVAVSDPVGFVSVTVPASSDAILAVPLNRAAEFKGVIQSISGSTLTVAGTSPGWATNQFVQALPSQPKTYAVQLASGTKEGMIGRVTSNSANSLTITLDSGENLSGVKSEAVDGVGQGDHIDIFPFWTPSSLITSPPPTDTQIMIFSGVVAGINIATSKSYTFDANWFDDDTFADASHVALKFGQGFVLRNNSASPLAISIAGSVPMSKHRFVVRTLSANVAQDTVVTIASPVPEKIGNLGLGFNDGDEIQVYNNATTGFNKAPSKIYYFEAGSWFDSDTFANVSTTVSLQPGLAYLFRLSPTTVPTNFVQSALPSYLTP